MIDPRRALASAFIGLVLAACATEVEADPTTADTAAPTPTQAATAEAAASAQPSEASGLTALDISWQVPFSITAPADWSDEVPFAGTTTANGVWFGTMDRYVGISRSGEETVDAWVDKVTTAEQLEATEPVEVEIGGAAGYRVDLRTSDEASSASCLNNGRCYTLFQDDSGYWPVVEGRTTRAWFVDVEGETLAIATDAPDSAFEEWVTTVEAALATLEWTD